MDKWDLHIYLRQPYHFVNSGKPENLTKYFQTLTDYQFISNKINHPEFGIQALIEDYDLLDPTQTATHPDQSKTLKYIQSALRLSAHIVTQDKQQLVSQLWGRLQTINTPAMQTLLTQAQTTHPHPWLRPLTPSLTQAGGRLLRTLSHSSSVYAVAVTADGKRVISGSHDNTVKVWNSETGEEQLTFSGHSREVKAVAVTADGKRLISGSSDNTVKVWNLETGEEQFTLTGHSDSVNTVAVTADGKRVISGSWDDTVKVWNLETGEEQFTLTGHSDSVNTVAVTADGKRVISGSWDNTVKVWNLETGEQQLTLTGHSSYVQAVAVYVQAVAVTADGNGDSWF
ncbi:WD40 repeat domain-containing protein, partial [Aphanizomenon flos-aquae]|uniref:WD40 repeat domain-containing protein n=1 Tax=Aphanizomenon flos-aquae TaxID=1176 RepID=UPI0013636613